MNCLPREILLHIFKCYLETESQASLICIIAKVCKRWKEICFDPMLWFVVEDSISLSSQVMFSKRGCMKLSHTINFGLQSKTKKVKRKKEGSNMQCTKELQAHLHSILSNSPKLKCINLSNIQLLENLNAVFPDQNCCPNLCEVIMNDKLPSDMVRLTPSFFDEFLTLRGSKLVIFNVSNTTLINCHKLFLIISKTCPNLEQLIAQNLDRNSKTVMFHIDNIQKELGKLKILHLSYPIGFTKSASIESLGFLNLETFTYPENNNYILTNKNFECLLMKSPYLKALDIRGCHLLTNNILCSLPTSNLEILLVSQTGLPTGLGFSEVLCKWSHSLKVLDISRVSHSSINMVLQEVLNTQSFPALESLDLNNTHTDIHSLKLILQNCPKLNFLQLESCRNLPRGKKRAYRSKEAIIDLCNWLVKYEHV